MRDALLAPPALWPLTTKLYQFPHSHFSEKARWALDHKRVAFTRVNLVRGLHVLTTRRLAERTSVPILEHEGRIVQDSTAILSYLDDRFPERSLVANSDAIRRQALEVEEYLDEDLGFHLRRFLYATLLAHRRQVTAFFLQGRSRAWRPLFAALFPLLRAQMKRQMQLTPANATDSERRLLGALDFLDTAVTRGRFLVGDSFTRADLTAAALLSLLTWPEKHDFRWPGPAEIVEPLAGFRRAVAGRPCFGWALGLYRDYR